MSEKVKKSEWKDREFGALFVDRDPVTQKVKKLSGWVTFEDFGNEVRKRFIAFPNRKTDKDGVFHENWPDFVIYHSRPPSGNTNPSSSSSSINTSSSSSSVENSIQRASKTVTGRKPKPESVNASDASGELENTEL